MTLGSSNSRNHIGFCWLACALLGGLPHSARAQGADAPTEPAPMAEPAPPAAETPAAEARAMTAEETAAVPVEATAALAAPPPPPYSLPFQLRPAAAATVVRSDTAFAFYENPVSDKGGFTVASMLLGSYKLTPISRRCCASASSATGRQMAR